MLPSPPGRRFQPPFVAADLRHRLHSQGACSGGSSRALFNHNSRALFVGGSSLSAASVLLDLGFSDAVWINKGQFISLKRTKFYSGASSLFQIFWWVKSSSSSTAAELRRRLSLSVLQYRLNSPVESRVY
ncbi:hypothetical protein SDJN03_03098, partial [Cucurbita argyrosperma subsp. sororia]